MSVVGQTEKNSVRAYVFRFALELGQLSMQSSLRFCANWRLMRRRNFNSLLDHFVGAGEQRCAETFTTSSVFVICCIGSLDGLSPLSMRAAQTPSTHLPVASARSR